MFQKVSVAGILIYPASWLVDELRISEISMEVPVRRTQDSCSGDTGQGDDMRVIGPAYAQAGNVLLFWQHCGVRLVVRSARGVQLPEVSPGIAHFF